MKPTRVVLIVTLVGVAGAAEAREAARTMADLADRVAPGTEVDVIDREGRVFRGELAQANGDGVLLAGFGGAAGRRVPAAEIATVTRHGDPLRNGMLIGGALGAASSLLVFTTDDSGEFEPICLNTGCKVATTVFMTGFYAGIGALIDRMHKGREAVYRAPADRVSWSVAPYGVRGGGGARLALRF